jgi:hypothetical protein
MGEVGNLVGDYISTRPSQGAGRAPPRFTCYILTNHVLVSSGLLFVYRFWIDTTLDSESTLTVDGIEDLY